MANKQIKKLLLILFAVLLLSSSAYYLTENALDLAVDQTHTHSAIAYPKQNKTHSTDNSAPHEPLRSSIQNIEEYHNKKASKTHINQPSVLTRKDRINWHIDGALNKKISALKSAFKNGEMRAGYILAMNLKHCWSAPVDQSDFDNQMQNAQSNNETDDFIVNLTHKYQKCAGVSQSQKQHYYHYMKGAATQGFIAAQESYAQLNAEFYMTSHDNSSLTRDEYIAKRDSFITEKLNFLQQAVEYGSLKASVKLVNMYNSQNYGPKGWIKAYAYSQVILAHTDDNSAYARYQWYIEKLAKNMNSDDVFSAEILAEKLNKKILSNGTLYTIQ